MDSRVIEASKTVQNQTKVHIPGMAALVDSLVTDPSLENVEGCLIDIVRIVKNRTHCDWCKELFQ